MNKEQLLAKIKELNLPKEELYILSGGSLLLMGIRTNTNDIDLVVIKKCFEILKQRFNINKKLVKRENGSYEITKEIECFIEEKERFKTEVIEDCQVQSLSSVLKLKKEMNREKDLKDIRLISEYVKSNIKIRKAVKGDVKDLATLIDDCWKKTYKNIMPIETLERKEKNKNEKIKKWENNVNNRNGFVVELNKKIVGYCEYILKSDLEAADCEITILYIDNNYQSLGIGKELVEFVKSKLKQNNKNNMAIRCLEENINGRKFYKKIGGIELEEIVYYEYDNKKYKQKTYIYEI